MTLLSFEESTAVGVVVPSDASSHGRQATVKHAASFRDPSGFIFRGPDNELLRQVNTSYQSDFSKLNESGLYESLVEAKLLIEHEEVDLRLRATQDACCVIKPKQLDFVSYPYEWSFSQLRDAALLTLEIQRQALDHDMTLKDASAYNVQFIDGRPIFIDTLSFESHESGQPWVAYRQFCSHFLAPLALMAYRDPRLNRMLATHLDGVPLDIATSLLPWRTRLRFGLLTHLHLHSRMQQRHQDTANESSGEGRRLKMSLMAVRGMLDSLERTVRKLRYRAGDTEWADYYDEHSYSDAAHAEKKRLVGEFVSRVHPDSVWDLGANTGVFSRIASESGAQTIAFDIDPACVERNYLRCQRDAEQGILPLCLDLTNPSPGIGWANRERDSLADRGPADMVLALALVHHLAITGNVPLSMVAEYFSRLGKWLVIEFIPKSDSQVARLLRSREDIFADYSQPGFESAFGQFFRIEETTQLEDGGRCLYLMRAK